MSKREKFYFSKYYTDSKDKNFYKLYKHIESKPNSTFDDWRTFYTGQTIGKNLSSELNYLYQHILRALHIYRINSKNTSLSIIQNLQYIEILLEKEQYSQALKILNRTKKMAYRHEEYSILVKILSIQEELEISTIDSDLPEKMKGLEAERKQCLDYIQNYFELKKLRINLIGLQYKEGMIVSDKNKYIDLFYHPLLEDISLATSKRSIDIWYFCNGLANHLLGKYDEAADFDEKRVQYLIENNYLFSSTEILKALNNLIYLLIDQENFIEATKNIELLFSYENDPSIKPGFYSYFKNYLYLKNSAMSGNNADVSSFVYNSIKELKKYFNELNLTQQNEWYLIIAFSLVQIKDYSRAIKILNEWAYQEILEYTIIWRKILRMICFYETESFILLNSEILSFMKAIKRRQLQSQTIDLLLHFFRICVKNKAKSTSHKQELYESMLVLKNIPAEKRYYLEMNILNWAKE